MKDLISRLIRWRILRYLISGGTAASANLLSLFVMVEFFHIWYLTSAVLSFIIGICVSFIMQKFFTFGDYGRERIRRQGTMHVGLHVFNLWLNTVLMYVGVDIIGIPYLLSQILIGCIIMMYNFLIYRHFVFVSASEHPKTDQ